MWFWNGRGTTANTDPVTIVCSSKDPASRNIAENLLADHRFSKTGIAGEFFHRDHNVRMIMVEKSPIYVEPNDVSPNSSSIIFASKHVSATNTPAMTVHATGNFTMDAKFGGKPEEVSYVDPSRIQQALRKLKEVLAKSGVQIDLTMEATHHGPTSLPAPVCFVEIGSELEQWTDPKLGEMAADAILAAAITEQGQGSAAVGFGGTHYSAKFTRLNIEGSYQVGHVVPRHALEAGVSESVLRDTLHKTLSPKVTALVDWKGVSGEDRRKLVANLEDWGYLVERC